MSDLRQFGKRIRVIGKAVEDNANRLKRAVAVAVDSAVVVATPVDTGRARANWQVNLNGPAQGTRDPFVPGFKGSTGAANTEASIAAAQLAIAGAKSGDVIHITNNLDYIGKLNDGSSAQAPVNFVEEAALAGAMRIKGARILVDGSNL